MTPYQGCMPTLSEVRDLKQRVSAAEALAEKERKRADQLMKKLNDHAPRTSSARPSAKMTASEVQDLVAKVTTMEHQLDRERKRADECSTRLHELTHSAITPVNRSGADHMCDPAFRFEALGRPINTQECCRCGPCDALLVLALNPILQRLLEHYRQIISQASQSGVSCSSELSMHYAQVLTSSPAIARLRSCQMIMDDLKNVCDHFIANVRATSTALTHLTEARTLIEVWPVYLLLCNPKTNTTRCMPCHHISPFAGLCVDSLRSTREDLQKLRGR
jgi:hypothetical protein